MTVPVNLASQPIRNHLRNPVLRTGTSPDWTVQTPSGSAIAQEVGTGPNGENVARVTVGSTAGQLRIAWRIGASPRVPVVPGLAYTVFVSINSPRTLANVTVESQYLDAAGTSIGFTKSSAFTLGVGWQTIRLELTPPANAAFLSHQQILGGNATAEHVQPGDVFLATRAMVAYGRVADYGDGDTPRWVWRGDAGTSESVGYPLPRNILPDSNGMSGFAGGGNTNGAFLRMESTNAAAVPGCPWRWLVRLGDYDNKISDPAAWAPTGFGTQSWTISGWAVAPEAITHKLLLTARFGETYANSPPKNDFIRTVSPYFGIIPELAAADFRTWKPFVRVISFTLPTDAVPRLTPNFNGGGWQIANLTMRHE